ncbi:YrpD family protein [Paenibacillus sp. KACC 21273]|uniref:YrpD family protein n=1 Tax=Paenibacillus sp. KACC 21273 TaxID=3025665 RepID=UPI002366F675|nr:YrpD family protein [Paenibacillus sp. KACC 21273]WDF50364.1 YrpD family protein [Paenibacillus sp. KACC 21273]
MEELRKFITVIIIGMLFLETSSLKISAADVSGTNSTVTANTYTQDNNLLPSFVKVTNAANVSTQNVNKFISQAQSVIKENRKTSQPSEFSQMLVANKEIYDYFYIDEANKDLYFYEDSFNSNPIAKIVDLNTHSSMDTSVKSSSNNSMYIQNLASLASISGGMGARATIPSGNLLEARIHTDGDTKQLNLNKGTSYTYVGFTGSKEADAGLQYSALNAQSNGHQVWKPYLKLSSSDPWSTDTMLNGYDAVQFQNGYIPGEEVQVSFWKNYIHDNVRTTRLKLQGLAKCANSTCSNASPTKLAVIMEKNGTGVANIDSYKVLATIADVNNTKASGQVNSSVTNITVDGVPKTPVQDAKSTNSSMSISSNSVTFKIK